MSATTYTTLTTTATSWNSSLESYPSNWTSTTSTSVEVWGDRTWEQWVTTAGTVEQAWGSHDVIYRGWVADEAELARQRDQHQAELEAQTRRLHAETLQRQERATEAQATALELFQSLLTSEQLAEMDQYGRVTVRGSEGGLYRLETHRDTVHGNVVETDEHGCFLGRACVAPEMYDEHGQGLPVADGWVGQLLALRHEEQHLRRVANWSGQQGGCQHPEAPILRGAA